MTATKTITAESILADYAADIAFVAEEDPATTLADLATQLYASTHNFDAAGINGTDELKAAAAYLVDAATATDDTERTVLLKKAAGHLAYASDMASEFRDMV
ncbi:hypothetical protein AB0E67_27215 [Streptomyces sp. NPDC032161]|uniref:hypothetical protein n=1 Tax=unclassified Streptomyces TaxID=2593676 RepID=UPI0033F29796